MGIQMQRRRRYSHLINATQAKPWVAETKSALTSELFTRVHMPTSNAPHDIGKPPKYGTKPKRPGLYLGLFHGRNLPHEKMDNWGFNGPAVGPLRWCHTTYATDIKIEFLNAIDAVEYFGVAELQFELNVDGDLIVYDGKYYGDWTVYYVESEDCERPMDEFRETPRVNVYWAHRRFML